jgi:hypothetical protein
VDFVDFVLNYSCMYKKIANDYDFK